MFTDILRTITYIIYFNNFEIPYSILQLIKAICYTDEKDEQHELHRFLGTLFSKKIEADKKLDILENEYHILRGKALEEDVKTMCNLSEGIEEEAMEAGKKELLKQLIKKKIVKGKSVETIANELEQDVLIIQPIIDEIKKGK